MDTATLARRLGLFTLDAKREPVPAPDLLAWADWMAKQRPTIGLDPVGELHVSTVFLGIDAMRLAPPRLYETLIFNLDGPVPGCQWRACTWEEAVAQHAHAVRYAAQLAHNEGKAPEGEA